MKTHTATQELLLNIHSSFCKREWCEKTDQPQQPPLSATEKLKAICWDGLLPDMLPEICIKENNKPLVLWELMGLGNMLHLKMGGYNEKLDATFALHPYMIMDHMLLN